MNTILWCTLAALAGLPLGYAIGCASDEINTLFDAYMDGMGTISLHWPAEVWRA